jgi:hypothetical protein
LPDRGRISRDRSTGIRLAQPPFAARRVAPERPHTPTMGSRCSGQEPDGQPPKTARPGDTPPKGTLAAAIGSAEESAP